MSTSLSLRKRRLMRMMGAAAMGCGLLAPLATLATMHRDMILVIAGLTLPAWIDGVAILALSGALFMGMISLHAHEVRDLPAGEQHARPMAGRTVSAMAMTSTFVVMGLTAGFLLLALLAHFFFGDNDYVSLEPSGSHGCRVVVHETSFLMGGSGTLYAVDRWGLGRETGRYTSDDGSHPFTESGYDLTWHRDSATVTFDLDPANPAWPSPQTVRC
jgi:hypothetical protein